MTEVLDVPPVEASGTGTGSRNPLRWFMRWLRRPLIEDPVERRNAPMLQVLLLIFGIFFPLSVVPHWLSRNGAPIDVAAELKNLAVIVMIWSCFALVRRGRFRLSASLFIWMTLALMAFSYAHYGLRKEMPIQVTQVFPLILGALLLGRRMLWAILFAIFGVLGIGAVVDAFGSGSAQGDAISAAIDFTRCGVSFLVLAVILDRSVSALRDTLNLANLRGEDLQRTQRSLEREIAEKERSQAQLIQAQKVEAVGRVSSGLAHDFGNVLAVIIGYASRPDATTSPAVAAESLDGIKLAAQRGAMAVRRVLSLGRARGTVREIVDVRTVIEDMQPLMRQLFGARVRLHTRWEDADMPVCIDRGELELMLLNVATNARDAMPGGGTFTIETRADGEFVHLVLADDGVGMGMDAREHLFDLFYTTKPQGRGSGIGMAMVRGVVETAGGDIEVSTEEGRGTALHIRLPRAPASRTADARTSVAGLRVLLVEDDEALRGLLADALQGAGALVQTAGSGEDAVSIARDNAELDVLVSDFHLPDMDGNDVLEKIAALHPSVRCLVISANESLSEVRRADGQDVALLAKPFAPQRLVEAVAAQGVATPVDAVVAGARPSD